MRKIIVLSISILVTLVGTFLLGLYDFNVWLNPDGKNSTKMVSEYRAYLVQEAIDFGDNETPIENTKEKIDLSRILSNYKYSSDPIYHNENEYFTIDIYLNQFWHANSNIGEIEYDHLRYEVFIYNVNYDLLKEKFSEQALPGRKNVAAASYPYFVINFYPNEEYNDEEAMRSPKVDSKGDELDTTAPIILYNDEKLQGCKLGSSSTLTLFDYSSTPAKDTNNEEFRVNFLAIYDYSTFVGNDDYLYNDNRELFTDGGYVKVDAVLEIDDKGETFNYILKDSLLKDKVEGFTFDTTNIEDNDYHDGFVQSSSAGETIKNVQIEGVKSYNSWAVGKYLWWHCLCAFAVLALIMTGFYFIFTYEEKGKMKKKSKKGKR